MEQYYFNRIYSLKIGFEKQPNLAKEISGLRITFDIVKTEGAPATCEISINNLSDETRAWIKEGTDTTGSGGMTVVLYAGYEELHGRQNIPLLFMGNIMTVSHDVTKPEIVTHLTCYEGILSIKKSTFKKSYPAGVRVAQIINDVIAAVGVSTVSGLPFSFSQIGKTDYILNRGYTFSGNAADLLDKLAQGYGFRWMIQSNRIKIYSKFDKNKKPGHDNNPPAKGVLIGSPKRLGKDQTSSEMINFKGYEFKCLLLPEAEVGGTVQLSSITIPQSPITLTVAEVSHHGDSWGEAWETNIKSRNPN
jgi:hypothetical protein